MDASNATRSRFERIISSAVSGWLPTLVYYVAVLVGLVVVYGAGDVPTTGFIYQAF